MAANKTQGPSRSELDRLADDLRVFDVNGIERAAWGWDRHEARGLDAYHPAERAALLGSQILGLAVSRYVLKVPPLAHMSRAELEAWVTPVIRHYLTDPAPA